MTDTPRTRPSARFIIIGFVLAEIIVIAAGVGPWLNDRHLAQGRRLAREKKYGQAIAHYNALFEKSPGDATVNYELGLVYYNDKQFEKAIEHFKIVARVLSRPPDDLYTKMGIAYLELGHEADALLQFHQALRQDPDDPVASFYVGDEFLKADEYETAAAYLERAAFHSTYGGRARQRLEQIEQNILGALAATAPAAGN